MVFDIVTATSMGSGKKYLEGDIRNYIRKANNYKIHHN